MIGHTFDELRGTAIAVAVVLSVFCGWWLLAYQPRLTALVKGHAELDLERSANRDARMRMVELGIPGTERAIEDAELALASLAERVPSAEDPTVSAALTRSISEAAARYSLKLHELQPIDDAREEPFLRHDIQITVSGGYHDIGGFLTDLLSLSRLTQIRAARLQVLPDAGTSLALAGIGESVERPRRSDSAPRAGLSSTAGDEPPHTVVATITLSWFTLPELTHGHELEASEAEAGE